MVRNPIVSWLTMCIPVCSFFVAAWWIKTQSEELKAYLGKSDDELNPMMDAVGTLLCPFYFLYMFFKYGALIEEAQIKAGVPDAANNGVMHLVFCFLCNFGIYKWQIELNKIWEASGHTPAI
jgi:hypothetical protein